MDLEQFIFYQFEALGQQVTFVKNWLEIHCKMLDF